MSTRQTFGTLVTLAAVLTHVETAAAQELAGTWVPHELNAEILTRQPQNVRVLAIRETPAV